MATIRKGSGAGGPVEKRRRIIDKVNEVWAQLEPGVKSVLNSERLTRKEYMRLYSESYNYCCVPTQLAPRDQLRALRHRKLPKSSKSKTISTETDARKKLYDKLDMCLQEFLLGLSNGIGDKTGPDLLKEYSNAWNRFTVSAQVLNGMLGHMNRKWIHGEFVRDENDSRKKFQIYNLALANWKKVVFSSPISKVNAQLIADNIFEGVINDRHNAPTVDRHVLRNVVQSIIGLGSSWIESHDECDKNNTSVWTLPGSNDQEKDQKTGVLLDLTLYKDLVETPFIKITGEYCNMLATNYLLDPANTITDYVQMLEGWITSEELRIRSFLPQRSHHLVFDIVDTMLLRNYMEQLQEIFGTYLAQSNLEGIALLFRLVARLDDQLPALYKVFGDHMCASGRQALEQVPEADLKKNSKRYVMILIEVHDKYRELIKKVFDNHMGFVSALDIACSHFVNNNTITETASIKSRKSAELLCQYCDSILRKSKNVEEQELDNVMTVFKYLKDKDAFQLYYVQRLSCRLINSESNDDAEAALLAKVKFVQGYEFTARAERLFKDITVSKDLSPKFKAELQEKNVILAHDFQIRVLAACNWPLKTESSLTFPEELQQTVEQFKTFYEKAHGGRTLKWLHNRCKGELSTTCFGAPHRLQLSLIQMAILLMYNDADVHNFKEIHDTTGVNPEQLIAQLSGLVEAGILLRESSPASTTVSNAQPDQSEEDLTSYKLNLDYQNPRYRVQVPETQSKGEKKAEKAKKEASISDGRSFILQACIIRIMKSRKKVTYNELRLEVLQQTHNKFSPDEQLLKRCIQILIDKEYLAREVSPDGEGEEMILYT